MFDKNFHDQLSRDIFLRSPITRFFRMTFNFEYKKAIEMLFTFPPITPTCGYFQFTIKSTAEICK